MLREHELGLTPHSENDLYKRTYLTQLRPGRPPIPLLDGNRGATRA
jgi:hypothetical protein